MQRFKRPVILVVILSMFATLCFTVDRSSAYAAETSIFLDPPDVHYYTSCGRFWPSSGEFQTTHVSGDTYSVTLRFTLTKAQLSALACVDRYLELDFRIFGFSVPAEWDDYTAYGTNIPGAIHDVATFDPVNTATPGVTRILVSDLRPNVEYFATIGWNAPLNPSDGLPRVSIELVPSHWATSVAEKSFCAVYRIPKGDAECIFGTTRVYLSEGYDGGASLPFDGYRWWDFGTYTPTSSGISPPPNQPMQPPAQPSFPAAQMFLRGDSMVFARSGIGTTWTQETDSASATKIASSSTGVQMLVASDASVWAKRGIGYGGWSQETTPGNATAIAVGGETQMFLRGDSTVFATNSIGGNWVQETAPATATAIAVSSTGIQMIIAADASIWAKTSIGYGGWTQEVGPGNANKIAIGGNTQVFIRGDAAVFARSGTGSTWTQETSPGNAGAIAASDTGTQMFIRGDAAVFARSGIGTSWTQETSAGNAWAIAAGTDTQLFARGDNALFARSGIGTSWTQENSAGNTGAIATG